MTDRPSQFNAAIAVQRRQNLRGVYDLHTNFMQYPKIMQPTHARWEHRPPPPTGSQVSPTDFGEIGSSMNDFVPQIAVYSEAARTIFPEVPSLYKRKFMISDTYCESPPMSTLGYPGPDEALLDIGPPGLTQISDEVIAELPVDCRRSFFKARAAETEWKGKWSTELENAARAKLKITYNV